MAITRLTDQSASAPVLTGAAGSLLAVLHWCLVTNLGWTKTHTATNKGMYRAPTGRRMYFGIDDSATLQARLRGYETGSAAGVAATTGGPFPTNAQVNGGYYMLKGLDTTTPVPWVFFSNGTTFYFFCDIDTVALGNNTPHLAFGDFVSYAAVDNYNVLISASAQDASPYGFLSGAGYSTYCSPRAIDQVAGSNLLDRAVSSRAAGILGSQGATYPDPVSGKLLVARVELLDAGTVNVRGFMPGLFEPMHISLAFDQGDTITGGGDLAGRALEVRKGLFRTANVLVETSDTWST